MKIVPFTQFRKHASEFFSEVENGETLIVLRHGRAIAEIKPAADRLAKTPSWKKPRLGLSIEGASLSDAILNERRFSR